MAFMHVSAWIETSVSRCTVENSAPKTTILYAAKDLKLMPTTPIRCHERKL